MKAILSLLFLAILLVSGWAGYKKGLIMGVGSLLAFIISIYGANLLSTTFSSEIIPALRPFASGYVETEIVTKQVRPALGIDDTNLSTEDYLAQNPGKEPEFCTLIYENMGIYQATAAQMATEAMEYAAQFEVTTEEAVVEVLCQRISYVGGFILAFLLLIIILTVIGNIPNLSFKIPNLDLLNDAGGAVLGLVQGVCFCLVIAWALKFTGLLLPQETLSSTFLVSWFMKANLLTSYLGI